MVSAAMVQRMTAARAARLTRIATRWKWYDQKIVNGLVQTMDQRLDVVGAMLRERIVANLSIPVETATGPRGGRRVIRRSKPGEFPRAETRELMRTIFFDRPAIDTVRVGTPLLYGVRLELRMQRSFLYRTVVESLAEIRMILGRVVVSLNGVPMISP